MQNERTLGQSLIRVLGTAAAVLAFALILNAMVSGEGWSLFDIILVEVLVAGSVLVYELCLRIPGTAASALLVAGMAAAGGAGMIVGEVDDAPGLIVIGIGLVAVAARIAYKSSRQEVAAPEASTPVA